MAIVALIYWATGIAGVTFASLPGNITPIWVPSGIAVAVILLWGYRMRWSIFLAALAVELFSHHSSLAGIFTSVGIALSNVLQSLIIAWLMNRLIERPVDLLSHSDKIFGLVLIAAVITLITATTGTAALLIEDFARITYFVNIWWTWWLSDLVGILIFSPLILTWQPFSKSFRLRRKLLETLALISAVSLVGLITFVWSYPLEYMFVPLLVWSAFRFGRATTTLLIVLISLAAVISTVHSSGPFVRTSLNDSLLLLESFMGVVAISTLFLSAVITERQRAHEDLQKYNETLEQKVTERTIELQRANIEIHSLNEQLRADNVRMSAELAISRRLQRMVLPREQELKQISDLDIAAFMEPATEVGGDYYDILQNHGQIKIGIGDVTGHGLESGVLMLMVQTAVRTLLACEITDAKVFLGALNRALYDNIKRMNINKNLTLSLLDYDQGTVRISGQHEEILWVRQDGAIETIDTLELGFMIGLKPDITALVAQREIHLQTGEGLVLYTDGITEAENEQGEPYGLPRLCQQVSQVWQLPAIGIQQAVINDVRQFMGSQRLEDDITLVVLKKS